MLTTVILIAFALLLGALGLSSWALAEREKPREYTLIGLACVALSVFVAFVAGRSC